MKAYAAAGLPPPRDIVWAGGPVEIAQRLGARARHGRRQCALARRRPRLPQGRGRRRPRRRPGGARQRWRASRAWRAYPPSAPASTRPCCAIASACGPICAPGSPACSRPASAHCSASPSSSFGFHSAPSLGPLEYFHDVCDLQRQTEVLRGLWQIAENASWMRAPQACVLAGRAAPGRPPRRQRAAALRRRARRSATPTAGRLTPGRACWCPAGSSSAPSSSPSAPSPPRRIRKSAAA